MMQVETKASLFKFPLNSTKVHVPLSLVFKSHLQAYMGELQASFEKFILHSVQHTADAVTGEGGGV